LVKSGIKRGFQNETELNLLQPLICQGPGSCCIQVFTGNNFAQSTKYSCSTGSCSYVSTDVTVCVGQVYVDPYTSDYSSTGCNTVTTQENNLQSTTALQCDNTPLCIQNSPNTQWPVQNIGTDTPTIDQCSCVNSDPNAGTCGSKPQTCLYCPDGQTCTNGVCTSSTYSPVGPQQNVDPALLIGWSICYQDTYDVNMQAMIPTILANCNKGKIMLACSPVGSPTIQLLSWATRDEVFTDTGASQNQGHLANGAQWYYDPNYSWGFANGGDNLFLFQCDESDDDPLNRLCWHTVCEAGGYRCGANTELNDDSSYARYIYQAN